MKNDNQHIQINEKYFDRWAKTYDNPTWETKYLRRMQIALIALLDIKEGIYFLDVGCGTGFALAQIAASIDGKSQFYGIDLSQEMINKAEGNFKGKDNFHFIRANAESIPLSSGLFDIIICTNSFHHYLNPVDALREMRRLLKAGGKAYVLDPTTDTLFLRLLDKFIKYFEPEHVKMYNTKEFQQMIIEAGFKYAGVEVLDLRHQNASLLERIINYINKNKVHIGEK